jgi:hypothetical protein
VGLVSALFQHDRKLEAALVSDPAHIFRGAAGDHVGKIQTALIRTDGASIDRTELDRKFYGPSTAAAVLSFKKNSKRNILNFRGQFDDIVGKKTTEALDKEMFALEGGPAPTPTPPTPAPPVTMSALAEKDKATSLQWAGVAVARLSEARNFLVTPPAGPIPGAPPILPPRVALTFDALEIHFHISTATIPLPEYIAKVIAIYQKDINLLNSSGNFFIDDTTSAEAAKGTPAHVPFGSGKVNFTPAFKERDSAASTGFGPKCRAAMVLHEPVHVVDHPDASLAANHVSELASNYATQPAANQLHNAHSYAAFAQHVFFGTDTRFGAGKPEQ